jgi:hypothetical protein
MTLLAECWPAPKVASDRAKHKRTLAVIQFTEKSGLPCLQIFFALLKMRPPERPATLTALIQNEARVDPREDPPCFTLHQANETKTIQSRLRFQTNVVISLNAFHQVVP